MVLNRIIKSAVSSTRNISTSLSRNSHDTRDIFGSNLPFQVKNKYRLLAIFTLYWGSGLALPYICLRQLMLRDKSD